MFYLRDLKRADNTTSSGIKLNSGHSGKHKGAGGNRTFRHHGRGKKIIHRGNKKHRVLQWFYLHMIVVFSFTMQSTSFTSVAFFVFRNKVSFNYLNLKWKVNLGSHTVLSETFPNFMLNDMT